MQMPGLCGVEAVGHSLWSERGLVEGVELISGYTAGTALWFRGIRTAVHMRRCVLEVTAHVEGERQEPTVQVHHHILLVFLQGEKLVTSGSTTHQLPTVIKGGQA